MAQAVPRIAQSERGNWALFDDYNRAQRDGGVQ